MERNKIQNLLTAFFVFVVLGATLWSLAAHEPGIFQIETALVQKFQKPEVIIIPAQEEPSKIVSEKDKVKPLIEKKQLSKHPAKFFKKEIQ